MNSPRIPSSRIFVVEPDDDTRPLLKDNLQRWGYQVIVAIDETDAIQRLRGGQERFNLILLNQTEQSLDEVMAIGRNIRQYTDLDGLTPILIIAEQYGADLEGQDVHLGDHAYVSYLEDGQQLKLMIQKLCRV
ncbi:MULTISPECIES: hypothetical protein [unclassified Leptolyngbya]|uniref:hypothetical protein n=1 Tax=unclassified Leptolyngbya TaxID=2650499 RepID=UPI0016896172|nr:MULTISPECIES: hypothetical protein [unclassified Leptolyngbya]MBD1909155.1 hypothetical protein [Leptolyngbya sp. FACHB-8]MBD2158465.1 hypothetical protein [Leptolyngbya sp. FACHB-16]